MSESSHDLVAARAARVREILRIVGAGQDEADDAKERPDGPVKGTWSAWNS